MCFPWGLRLVGGRGLIPHQKEDACIFPLTFPLFEDVRKR